MRHHASSKTHDLRPAAASPWRAVMSCLLCTSLLTLPEEASALIGGEPSPGDEGVYSLEVETTEGEKVSCSGVAITPRQFLTAGHCVAVGFVGYDPLMHVVTSADTERAGSQERFEVIRRYLHPNFNQARLEAGFDLAILLVSRDLPVHVPIRQAPLPEEQLTLEAIGYGIARHDDVTGETAGQRRVATVPILARRGGEWVDVGDEDTTPCHGDSGGPLRHGGELIAILSHGPSGCRQGMAATLILPHMDFLAAVTRSAGEEETTGDKAEENRQDDLTDHEATCSPTGATPPAPRALLLCLLALGLMSARSRRGACP